VARPVAPVLASVLEAQNARYSPSERRGRHLGALRQGAAAVVTGQQTGLFLGPLYTIYKTASTVRLARWLAERWGDPVVPVFWLQTEDHDAEEIATCHVSRGSDEPLTLALPFAAEHVPVAHRTLPGEVEPLLARLREALGSLPHGEEHLDLLGRHYRRGAGWGPAFAGVLAELFAEEGLVLIDPRDPALAPLAAPLHRRSLEEAGPIAAALAERVRSLEARGWSATVHVRDGAPLSFFHPDGPAGPRCRLGATEEGLVEIGRNRRHTLDELLRVLEATPSAFSTSALLRPVLQDAWLPTAAYVGGPGEIAYFAQLPPLYAAFGVTMPVIVPRTRVRLIDRASRQALDRRGLTPAEVCRPLDEVIDGLRGRQGGEPAGDDVARRVVEGVDATLDRIASRVREAGPRAVRSLEKSRRTLARSAAKLGRDFDRARLLSDRELVQDVTRVQSRLMPRGIPQERFFGLPSFAARYGQRAFVERVLEAAEPLRTDVVDLAL
jgi:bacillithiol biosynthesis cysteine-adding enzyme BshC